MKSVVIDLARGFSQQVDPRVAPAGTILRTQNVRRDKEGRLVLRNGYQSLGTSVQDSSAGALVPFDLHNYNNTLLALGNHNASQSGIRAVYQFAPNIRGNWRTASAGAATNDTASFLGICAADAPKILFSELTSAVSSDDAVSDVAVIGNLACMVTQTKTGVATVTIIATIYDVALGAVVSSQIFTGNVNPRVIAVGNTFLFFSTNGTQVQVQKNDVSLTTGWTGFSNVGSPLGAAKGPYSVAPFELNSTDYLLVVATGTGYSWTRNNLAHLVQAANAAVSTANAPVDICGASGETISVVNAKATGWEIRTFATTGGLNIGPSALNGVTAQLWVSVARKSATQVIAAAFTASANTMHAALVNTSTHVLGLLGLHQAVRAFAKPFTVGGCAFLWETLSVSAITPSPYGLCNLGVDSVVQEAELEALALDGAAKTQFTDIGIAAVQHVVQGPGSKWYIALVALDSRDKTFRASLVEFQMFSGERRQSALVGDTLYLAGGCTTQYDGLTTSEAGFDTTPGVSLSPFVGGSLTPGATYQYVVVFRSVASNKEVTQSSPSAVQSVAMGASTAVSVIFSTPYSRRQNRISVNLLLEVYADIYRTEANGSIPRIVGTVNVGSPLALGQLITYQDTVSDAVQQSGALLYTQGDTALSGRKPLSQASSCRFIAEGSGKLLLGGLETPTQLQLSIENRPGESVGFCNDDIYFINNPGDVTGVVVASDGRRFVFTRDKIKEIIGVGPNAAGIGELSDPIDVDGEVGCNDWRSIANFEHGIMFRANNSRMYLLPRGGGSVVDAGMGIQDLLKAFPVTTGCIRHDVDRLLTYSFQNAAGTDGRVVHLDLETSFMSAKQGWISNWIVDRVAAFEDVPDIQVLSEEVTQFGGPVTVVTVNFPKSMKVGDRVVVIECAPSINPGVTIQNFFSVGGFNNDVNQATNVGGIAVRTRIVDGTEGSTFNCGWTSATAGIVKVYHLRGAHPSQLNESAASQQTATSISFGPLTPSWGAGAKTLWIAAATPQTVDSIPPILPETISFNTTTPGFGSTGASVLSVAGANAGLELAWQRASLNVSTLAFQQWFGFGVALTSIGFVLAVRPAVSVGTPLRAVNQLAGELVVCNATDVQRITRGSFADNGNVFVVPEIETATIYAMGPGGAARHLGVVLVGEFRQRCTVRCSLSYDDGLTYTELTPFQVNPNLYTVGQTIRLQWVPRRRKVEGVRALFTFTDDGSGPSEGIVFQQAVFQFEELLGASRLGQNFRK